MARPLQHPAPSQLVRLPVPVHLRGPPGRYATDRCVITPRVQDPGVGPGDTFAPAYQPEVVVISENKDTAIHFPELAGGLIVEGVGRGGRTVASFPWIREAPLVVYWGDMDRDGYEILNGYRIDFDRDLDSILMNVAAYEEFEPYGTNHDQNGRDLVAGAPRVVDHLRADELEVYLRLLHPEHSGHRRIEQERIPLTRALSEVERLVSPTN